MLRRRVAERAVVSLAREFPAVVILGPRQAGKSTLARIAFSGYAHFDLEDPRAYERLAGDPLFILSQHERLVLDEAQRMPALFPLLRAFLDEDPRRRVVILGSASPSLVGGVSESLAGRVGFFELGGMSCFEEDADKLWIEGGFPRVHWSRPRSRPATWYPAYLRATLEQDVPQLGLRVPATRMRLLLAMVASAQGGLSNATELGGSLGVTYHTVQHMLDVLEGVFLVRRLAPYFANLGKRLVKSPKLYIRDTGILHSLLGIEPTTRAVLANAKAGASFETFCIEQILLHARLADPSAEGWFFRTHGGTEVDLLVRLHGELIPFEIKLGVTPPDTRALESCMHDLSLRRGFVVSRAKDPLALREGIWMCSLEDALVRLALKPGRARSGTSKRPASRPRARPRPRRG